MRPESRKPFLAGLLAGTALGVVLTVGGLVAFTLWTIGEAEKAGLGASRTPPVPAGGQAVYGRLAEPIRLSSLAGDTLALLPRRERVALVNVWATWCAPCRGEMPSLVALRDSLLAEPIDFYCVSKEPVAALQSFVKKEGFPLPVYRLEGFLPDDLASPVIPLTFVVDRQGQVVFRHEGAANWDTEPVRRFLRGVCAEPPPAS
jgi:thiol-disulfide isomerase/thioredoxin